MPLPTRPIDDAPLRVVFMGSPEIARPTVERVLDGPERLLAIYCQPDKRAGRGRKLLPPPIACCADDHAVELRQPKTLTHPLAQQRFEALRPDVAVVVAYGKILPPAFLAVPRYGCINVHFSLLPKYRGAGPLQWAILRGEAVTGVTTMRMDEGLDSGPILLQREAPIRDDDTAESLGARLAELGADLLELTLAELRAGRLRETPQDHAAATEAPLLTKEDGRIDWTRPAIELDRQVRGTYPWPGAFTTRAGQRLKVLGAAPADAVPTDAQRPGEVVSASRHGVAVACGTGLLRLTRVQPAGKKAMDAAAFVNGARVQPGELWGVEP